MSNPVYLGIDIGTTAVKVAAFDRGARTVTATETVHLKTRTDATGRREQSAVGLTRAMTAALRGLRSRLGARWADVAGIGLAAQGGSTCICEAGSGRPLTPLLLWNDMRGHAYREQVTSRRPPAYWRRRLLRDQPGQGLARMLWFREHCPELLQPGNLLAGAGELCFHHLTGAWRQDGGSALQQGAYNAVKRCLDQDLLDIVGLPLSFLAPLRAGHETAPLSQAAAKELRLAAGLPVAGPYMDHEAGYMSVLNRGDRVLQCSLGTAWVANYTVPVAATWTSPVQIVLPSLTDENWLVVQPLRAGNVAWDWALETFVDRDRDRARLRVENVFKRRLLPASGSVGIPWLYVANPLFPASVGGGALFGLSAATDGEELVRMMALSLVCEMYRVCRALWDCDMIDCLVLGGGAAAGSHFRRLFAALFYPAPVYVDVDESAAGVRGAIYPLAPDAAAGRMIAVRPPAPSVIAAAETAYEEYLTVFDRFCADAPGAAPVTIESKGEFQ